MASENQVQIINQKVLNNPAKLQQLSTRMLIALVALANNPKQLNAIITAKNLTNAVAGSILKKPPELLLQLTPSSWITLSKICKDKRDLIVIMQITSMLISSKIGK